MIHGVTRGTVITPKHFLLGVGLHNITGQKKVIQVMNRFGHSISYDQVRDIELAQAQKAQIIADKNTSLPLRPATNDEFVMTVFWVDNFDIKVEAQTGGGSVNITTMMAFQEVSNRCIVVENDVNIPKSKEKVLQDTVTVKNLSVNEKREPTNVPFLRTSSNICKDVEEEFSLKSFFWLYLRYCNNFSQNTPTFSGWLLNLGRSYLEPNVIKTVETYLPPLPTKVTEWQTIYNCMLYLQKLANDVNMPYVNITLDVGAAINAYKVLWNFQAQFNNVFIHLGDFHFLKENFKVTNVTRTCLID